MSVQVPMSGDVDFRPSTKRAPEARPDTLDLKTFAACFDVFADAVGGVARLRGLILDLATRGRLVAQRRTDGHAQVLLEGDPPPRTPNAEDVLEGQLFELPSTWCWATLGQVCSYIQRGKSPRYVDTSSTPVVSQKCVQWEGFLIDRARFIDPASLEAYGEERFLRAGDLLWNSTGHGTVGRVAVFREDNRFPRVVADSHVTVLRPKIDPRYIWCWLASPTVQTTIDDLVSGTTKQTELATSTVVAHPMPLPPLAEQRRIVAKVDQLMAICDDLEARQAKKQEVGTRLTKAALEALTAAEGPEELEAAWKTVVKNFDALFDRAEKVTQLRGAIIGLACRGALTRRGRGSGREVLEAITKRRAAWAAEESKSGNREPARQIAKIDGQSPPSSPGVLPSGWSWATLLAGCIQLVDCHNKTAPYTPSGVMLVRTSNVRDGKIRLDGVRYVSESTYRFWSRRCPPAPGDLLFTREAPMGEVGLIEPGMTICMGQRMMLLRVAPDLLHPKYLLLAIQDPAFRDRMVRAAVGSTVKHLRVGDVESLLVPIPPFDEQLAIISCVSRLMGVCDRLEGTLQRAEDRATKLVEAAGQEMVA